YAYPWWKEKVIDSDLKRKDGLCPLTPKETALVLGALDIDRENSLTYDEDKGAWFLEKELTVNVYARNRLKVHQYP
ncbi:hypothetical protein ZEAMMB73_Zm00001d042356, partial [Zea mays]